MSGQEALDISLEFTPNPNTLKYVVNRVLLERGAANFPTAAAAAEKSPLAKRLFGVEGVTGVMVGRNFVTVTKGADGDWDSLNRGVNEVLADHLNKGLPIVDESFFQAKGTVSDSEAEKKIREVLENEIRPAVAMDGGDITFERYENGVVYLYLQGSCAGCPSSTMTLKMGIENRLKQVVPEIQEVVSI